MIRSIVTGLVVLLSARVCAAQAPVPPVRGVSVTLQASGQPKGSVSGGSAGLPSAGTGGVTTAVAAAVSAPVAGRFGVGAEFSLSLPFHDTQSSQIATEEHEHRENILAFLTQVGLSGQGPLSVATSFGPAIVFERTTTTRTSRPLGSPRQTSPPTTETHTRLGISGGLDLFVSLGARLSFVAPMRVTYVQRDDQNDLDLGLGRLVYRGGAGLVFRF